MPIVFAPPSPAGNLPGLEIQAGRGQAAMHDLPSLVSAMEAYQRAASSSAERATQASIASAGLQQRDREFQQSQMMQGALADAHNQQQAEMQAAAFQQQQAMAEQEVQNRIRLMNAQVTQQDMMRHTSLRGALADIASARANGEIDDATAAEAQAKVWGTLGPLQRQIAEGQIAQRQAAEQERTAELQRSNQLWQMQTGSQLGFWHQTANQLAGVPNPGPGAVKAIPVLGEDGVTPIGQMVLSPEGKTHFVPKEKAQGPEKLPPGVMSEQQFTGRVEATMKMTDKDLAENPDTPGGWQGAYERNLKRMGLPLSGSYDEYAQNRLQSIQSRKGGAPGQPQGISNADKPVGPQGAPEPRQVQLPELKPIQVTDYSKLNANKPEFYDQMTAQQKQGWDNTVPLLGRIDSETRFSGSERQQAKVFLGTMRLGIAEGNRAMIEGAAKNLDQLFAIVNKRQQPPSGNISPPRFPAGTPIGR